MTRNPFRGMMPIMPTAITADGPIDETSQRRAVQYCLQCGAVAIGHFGIASEFHKIADRDRTRLIEIIVDEVAGRVPFFVGVTSPGAGISLEYARQAADLGADMIMASLPYVDIPDRDGAFAFYEQLSRATPLPIIVQDTPACSSILSADLLWQMVRDIENVCHVKAEGKSFLEKTHTLLRLSGGRMSVIGGAGGKHLFHLLRLGVTAFMTGTEALDLHNAAVQAYLAGDEPRAADVYFRQILPYLQFYLDHSEELLKWMLYARGILASPQVLAPPAAPPMGESERREFEALLERIGWQRRGAWNDGT